MNSFKWIKFFSIGIVLSLSACSDEPEWVSIYNECKEQIQASIDEIKQSPDAPQAMGNMMQSFGMSACEMIKSTCEQDPKGAACQSIVNSHKEQK